MPSLKDLEFMLRFTSDTHFHSHNLLKASCSRHRRGTGALSSRHRCSLTTDCQHTDHTRAAWLEPCADKSSPRTPRQTIVDRQGWIWQDRSPKSHSTHSSGIDVAAAKLQSARHKAFGGPGYHLSIASRHRRCRRSAPQRLCAWPRRDWAGGEAQTSDG